MNPMRTIGTIAKEVGVGVETIRFYERKGLLSQPVKKGRGFRTYTDHDAQRILFVRRTQSLGFTLAEIKELLRLNASPGATCDDVKALAEVKLAEVEAKLRDLKRIRTGLRNIVNTCEKTPSAIACCRITDCLSGEC